MKKKIRQREQKAEQEKDLVVQDKLIRIKDQRVPRLMDLIMRPQLTGRKCVGTIEAHQNGLRFTSSKGEVLDILYDNIKHAIFQPCQGTTIVLIHFHLKDFIMIGKKKHKDVQFNTEVMDESVNLDGLARNSYDPDELEEEQREREMKTRLNRAFKDFCKKVEKVAKHYEHTVDFDIPYNELGFWGNPNREMVYIQPTVKCLVNLTVTPFFFLDLSEIEHVHFERVTYTTKNFDVAFVFKNLELAPRMINAIELKYLEPMQDWLNDVEITYTVGTANMSWQLIKKNVKEWIEDGVFYSGNELFSFYLHTEKKGRGILYLHIK